MSKHLTSVFIAHEREICSYLNRKIGNSGEAADLYQDAFLRLVGLKNPEAVKNPRGLIFTLVANLARDHLRRVTKRRKVELQDAAHEISTSELSAEETLLERQREAALQAAIDSLPERTRTVFQKYYVDGGSYSEVGDYFGISPRTVEYHLRQALTACRAYMRSTGQL